MYHILSQKLLKIYIFFKKRGFFGCIYIVCHKVDLLICPARHAALIIYIWEKKLMKRIHAFLKHKDDLLYMTALFIIISAFFVHAEDAFEATSDPMEASEALPFSDRTDEIVQELETKGFSSLTEILIQFGTYEKINHGTLHVHLFENERSIAEWQVDTAELADNTYHTFSLDDPLTIHKEKKYSIYLSDDFKGDNAVALWTSSQTKGMCYHNGILLKGTSVCYQLTHNDVKLKKRVLMIALIIFLSVSILLTLGVDEVLVMGMIFVTLGCVYMWLCPLYMAPDEESHFFRAFEISCGDLTSPLVPGQNGELNGGNALPSALAYSSPSDTIDWDDTRYFLYPNVSLYAPVSYLPQATGIKIARFFTDDVPTIFYAGRWGNLLVNTFLCLSALYLMPFCKRILFMVMTFPMAMQEIVSLAPDGFTISLSLALTAYIFHVSYDRREMIRKRDLAVIAALCMTVSLCKVIYIVLTLLVFMIPDDKFGTPKRGLILRSSIFGISVILNLIWLKISSGYLIEFTPGVDSTRQIQYVLSHIGDFYGIVIRTVIEKGDFFIRSMLGGNMGALSIEITPSVWIAFLILFLYEICNQKRLGVIPHRYDQLIMALVFLGGAALICASLYVQWTSLENEVIEGIQGRYFIPLIIFPALLIIYNNDKKKRETRYIIIDDTYKKLPLMLLLTLNGLTILDMIQYYLA